MLVLQGRNVNDLYREGMHYIGAVGVEQNSRNGRVLVAPTPVMSVYERPQERVLMDPVRNANPFFHVMESLWMLAGRDDAAFLDRYVGDFGKRFGEQDGRIHGAYGKRWRSTLGYDQLDVVVNKLRDNPYDRQAVIQMWDGSQYEEWRGGIDGCHAYGSDDLDGNWRDRPCNTHVYLRVREVSRVKQAVYLDQEDMSDIVKRELDLTVLCRSNDIVWGAYGANAVHFSVLQEYLAGRLGVSVGRMYQFSNNWHGYVSELERMGDPLLMQGRPNRYATGELSALPMGDAWEVWDEDLARFMEWHDEAMWGRGCMTDYDLPSFANTWFLSVASKVARANYQWKQGSRLSALAFAGEIAASDWRAACVEWMQRRMK